MKEEPKTSQQILQEARAEKIDSKAKFIKEYMNDHNGGTPRWLRSIFFTEKEKIEAILECMDNIHTSTLQSFLEAEIERWDIEYDQMSTGINAIPQTDEYANGWNDCRKEAFQKKKQYIQDQITHLKELLETFKR